MRRADEINVRLPIVAHEALGVDPCGCLFVRLTEDDQAEIVCNECGAVVCTLLVDEVEAAVQRLSETQHHLYGALSTLRSNEYVPGFSSVRVYVSEVCHRLGLPSAMPP